MRKCLFQFDDSPVFEGFTDNTLWNGFLNVWVSPAVRDQIIAFFDGEDEEETNAQTMAIPVQVIDGRELVSLAYGYATSEVVSMTFLEASRDLKPGSRVMFTHDFELNHQHPIIPAGTTGTVRENGLNEMQPMLFVSPDDETLRAHFRSWNGEGDDTIQIAGPEPEDKGSMAEEAAWAAPCGLMIITPKWKAAFPDFPYADMPAIPETWEDISWRNEMCPQFDTKRGCVVFVDFADPAQREFPECCRFTAHTDNDAREPLFETDDWQAVLNFVITHIRTQHP
jgi:hypothetical protein